MLEAPRPERRGEPGTFPGKTSACPVFHPSVRFRTCTCPIPLPYAPITGRWRCFLAGAAPALRPLSFFLSDTDKKDYPSHFACSAKYSFPLLLFLLTTFSSPGLVIFYFLKDHFQLSPAWLSVGFGLITLPWVAKPALAYITDTQYIFGQRRKPYMVLASLVTSLAYLGVGYQGIHSLPLAIFYLALAGAGRAFVLAALQGLIVEGTGGGARASGPLSEFFWLRSFGAVVAAYYGGLLLELVPASTILTGLAVLPLTICCMVSVFLTEEGRADNGEASARTPEKAWQEFCDAVSNPTFYGPIIYLLW